MIELAFEEDDVEGRIEGGEVVFDVLRDQRVFEHPAERGLGLIVLANKSTSTPCLCLELHDGKKEVGVEAETSIE